MAQVLFAVRPVLAAPVYTPYANSVAAQTGLAGGTANNAVGAPDSQNATLVGPNSTLTLDMGDGEEGTAALNLYLGAINLQALLRVELLDDNQAVLATFDRSLFVELQPSTQTFAYDWHSSGKGYRFVRITPQAALSFGVDAVEAVGFVGSSSDQDTDGDGIPDREDGNPLVVDPSSGGNGGGGGGNTSGGANGSNSGGSGGSAGGTNTVTNRNTIVTTRSGSTTPVNTPPTPANDKDGDQMDDAWELANGLDPNNKADGTEDTDKDGLINVKEFELDTNPRNQDTDADGIPDGWEASHGLNARVNDGEQDPDFDYVTNRGEYYFDTNPYVADNFQKLAAKVNGTARLWNWFLFLMLFVIAVLAYWQARKLVARARNLRSTKKSSKKKK